MLPRVVLLLLLSFFSPINSATFENVTVLFTTQFGKLFVLGKPPIASNHIESSNTLDKYINPQPFEVVTIRNGNIPQLPENSVADLPHIQHLSITKCQLKEIEPGAFKNLPRLDGLSLEDNLLKEIKNGVFTGLTIKSLYLSDNKISIIENAAFNNMTLTLISLNNNRLSRWNSDWFVGSPVGSIYMANNLIREIPADAFDYGLAFKKANVPLIAWHVVLAQNQIDKIHEDAFKHINGFGYLNLADNHIKKLPKDLFHSVKFINFLNLTNNKINTVEGVFDDINIYQLIINNNHLNCFPTQVFDISRINYVFVDNNPFTCNCVEKWLDFQVQNGAWIIFNMKHLQENCVKHDL